MLHKSWIMGLAASLLMPLTAGAEGTSPPPLAEIPCEGAAAAAVLQIPPPLDLFARVVCSNYGHAILSRQDIAWVMLQGQRQLPLALAQAEGELKPVRHDAYFTDIKLVEIPVEEQIQWMTHLKRFIPLGNQFSGKVMLLHARANTQAVHRFFFFVVQENQEKKPHYFGMICSPECTLEADSLAGRPFVVMRIPPKGQEPPTAQAEPFNLTATTGQTAATAHEEPPPSPSAPLSAEPARLPDPLQAQAAPQPAPPPPKETEGRLYRVRAGDSLWTIAKEHQISLKSLVRENTLANPHRISVGQSLRLPPPGVPSPSVSSGGETRP